MGIHAGEFTEGGLALGYSVEARAAVGENGPTAERNPVTELDNERDPAHDVVARILSRAGTALTSDSDAGEEAQLEAEERTALRRVGMSTELQDVTEVEYRQVRLERVVLVGIYTQGTAEEAEVSLRELAALAETAGS